MLRPVVGLALCAALTASAQSASPGASGPTSTPAPGPTPPAAPAGEGAAGDAEREQMAAFLEQYLAFDERTGEAYTGRARRAVTRGELYQLLGRPDLQARAEARAHTRTWLYVGAAASLAAGVGSGLALYATLPDLGSRSCLYAPTPNAPECGPLHARQSAIAGGLIAVGTGAALAMGLTALSYELHPVTRAELSRLVGTYNGELRRRLRRTGAAASAPSARLSISPVVGPAGTGLHAHLTF